MISRRVFLKAASLSFLSTFSIKSYGIGENSGVNLVQLQYQGGNCFPRQNALKTLSWEVRVRTSVDISLEPVEIPILHRDLFLHPFIYIAGDRPFQPFSREERESLVRFIRFGGMILIDISSGSNSDSQGFNNSIQRELREIGINNLTPIPNNHVIMHSFYLLNRPCGRIQGSENLKGWLYNDIYQVILSDHDLGGAWAKDSLGNWSMEVVPGGEQQREMSLRLGVNILLYSLCLNYKDDRVHLPFLQNNNQ